VVVSVGGALSEITAWAEPAVAGWRYLASSAYRARKHDDWRLEHYGYVILDILGGIIGISVSVFVVGILGVVAFQWLRH
jgi:hypothetical protein